MGGYRDEQVCPSCGDNLVHGEDNDGEVFQCPAMDCLQMYDLDEIMERD